MAARLKKIRHDEETRTKIKTSQIINRLMGHLNGEHELSATQVSVGLGLLRKTLPDLAAVAHSGELAIRNPKEVSDAELAAIVAAERAEKSDERTLN